ncbi:MAG TPA: hypothetical protein VFY93_20085 [Planctomycetota bacterium]|nr:hypothetical protein [Planctomycetota bacterium]
MGRLGAGLLAPGETGEHRRHAGASLAQAPEHRRRLQAEHLDHLEGRIALAALDDEPRGLVARMGAVRALGDVASGGSRRAAQLTAQIRVAGGQRQPLDAGEDVERLRERSVRPRSCARAWAFAQAWSPRRRRRKCQPRGGFAVA